MFKGYTPLIVIIKYWFYSICCIIYLWSGLDFDTAFKFLDKCTNIIIPKVLSTLNTCFASLFFPLNSFVVCCCFH